MRIGIVSDTHGNKSTTAVAVELLRQHKLERLLHCGDVCGSGIVRMLAEWPTHYVAGNCDDLDLLEQTVLETGQKWHGLRGEIELAGRRICLLHSHVTGALPDAIASGEFDLVCYGHTHRYEKRTEGQTLVLNPGALHRASRHSFAVVDLETMAAEHHFLP
ncbi:MAG: metallophosphoesterase family protein [Rubinisphaera brasiliensis]|uniref:metallophosphoesterase family protein n=1 Tax=Rubinisphaera brasiliensis TaxID=119 RepID=UPI00391DA189|nr:metallophosphoesterase family protein [bacterium]